MNAWRWVGRAALFGIAHVGLGAGLGALLADASAPAKGVTVTLLLLCSIATAARWVGAAGLGAMLLGMVAFVGFVTQVEQAHVVAAARFVEAQEVWPDGAAAVHFANPLLHETAWSGSHTWSRDNGKRTESRTATAVPLVARSGGPIIAFDCFSDAGKMSPDGSWVVQVEGACFQPIARSTDALHEAGQVLSPGASGRAVRLYASKEEFEDSGRLDSVYRMVSVLTLLYLATIVVFRERGARHAAS